MINEIVVTEPGRFESRDAALARRNSPEYLAILPIREATSTSRVYIVDGYDA